MQLFLLLTSLLLAVWSTEALSLGTSNECSWGVSYWCQSYDTAVRCGKVQHCNEKVWKTKDQEEDKANLPVSPGGAVECEACKLIVGYVDRLIENNATENETEDAVLELCEYVKSDVCTSLVKEFFPIIWDELVKNTDPDKVCGVINLCDSSKFLANTQPKAVGSFQGAIECGACKDGIKLLEKFFTEKSLEERVDVLCTYLNVSKSDQDKCKAIIGDILPLIWNDISDPETICKLLGICDSSIEVELQTLAVETKSKSVQDVECELCDIVVGVMEPFIDSNATQEEVKDALKKVCALVSYIESECEDFVEQFFPRLWALVESEFDNKKICSALGLCTTTVTKSKKPVKPVGNQLKTVNGDVDCYLCKLILGFMKQFVGSDNEKKVQESVQEMCKLLPIPFLSTQCRKLVDSFFPEIWLVIKYDATHADEICGNLGLCSNSTSLLKTKQLVSKNKFKPVKDELCTLCKDIVDFIRPFVERNGTKDEVQNALDLFCSIMPSSISNNCTQLVDTYFPLIWQLIELELDSDFICNEIKLCNSTSRVNNKLHFKTLKKNQPKQVKSGLCDVCTTIVNFVKPFIENNNTEAEAEAAVEELCSELPSIASVACDYLVKAFFPDIWNELVKDLNSDVCKKLGLCDTSTSLMKTRQPIRKNQPKQSVLCEVCTEVVGVVKSYILNNNTEAEAEAAVESLCSELPSEILTAACDYLVKAYFPDIWNELVKDLSSDVCQKFGFCSNSTSLLKSKPIRKIQVSLDKCDICQTVVSFLKHFVDSNSTEDVAKTAVEAICKLIPTPGNIACDLLVDGFFDRIWDLLHKEVDANAKDICVKLDLCKNSTSLREKLVSKPKVMDDGDMCMLCQSLVGIINVYRSEGYTKEKAKVALQNVCQEVVPELVSACSDMVRNNFTFLWNAVKNGSTTICKDLGLCTSTQIVKVQVKPVKQDLCDLCKLAVNFVKPFIDSNSTEQEVEDAIEGLCNLLPGDYGKDCDALIKEVFDRIWQLVKNDVDSGDICKQLGLCNSTSLSRNKQHFKPVKVKPVKQDLCDLCKTVVSFLKPFVDSNSTEAEVKNGLESLCDLLPSDFSKECESLVKNDFDFIWQLVKNEVDSGDICQQLGLCDSTSLLRNKQQVTSVKSSVECLLCELIVKELDSVLNSNSTEQEIISAVKKVCNILPSTVRTNCDEFIEKYGDEIIKLIVENADPDTICSLIQLCTSSYATVQLKDTGECDVCKSLLGFLKIMMKNDEDFFEHALTDYCGLLPGPLATECKNLVLTYGTDLIDDLADDINPDKLCQDVKLCTATKLLAKGDTSFPTFAKKKHSPRVQSSDIGCDVCTQVLEDLEVILPKEKNFLTGAFSMVCKKYLPEQANEVCQWVIVEFGDELVKLIADEINPREDCQAIKLCKSSPSLSQPWRSLSAAVPKQL